MAKLGPHCIRATEQALAFARRAPCVKALDDPAPLRVAQPNSLLIYRRYFPDQRLDADPFAVALEILKGLDGFRAPRLYVEVYNEVPAGLGEAHRAFLQKIIPILHGHGVMVCGPCASTGAYEQADWDRYCGIGLDAYAYHCYWGQEGFSVWHALRYRQYHQPSDPPLILTEVGRDKVEQGQGGWKKDGVSAEQYRQELLAYDAELAKDSYVLGATIFTSGATEDWAMFSTDELGLDSALAAPPYFPPDSPIVVPPLPPSAPTVPNMTPLVDALNGCWEFANQSDAAARAVLAANQRLRSEIVELKVALGLQPA